MKLLKNLFSAVVFMALATSSHASFEALPKDVQIVIFSQPVLSQKDLGRCAQVCKNWTERSSENKVWERFLQQICFFGISFCKENTTVNMDSYKTAMKLQDAIALDISRKAKALSKSSDKNDINIANKLFVSLEYLGDKHSITTHLFSLNTDDMANDLQGALITSKAKEAFIELGSQIAKTYEIVKAY